MENTEMSMESISEPMNSIQVSMESTVASSKLSGKEECKGVQG